MKLPKVDLLCENNFTIIRLKSHNTYIAGVNLTINLEIKIFRKIQFS